MMRSLFVLSLMVALGASAEVREYDIVVYGGTSAGVSAAVAARRIGKTAAIVAPEKRLGGMSSNGLGATDSGDRSVIGGIAREFYHRLWIEYQKDSTWTRERKPVDGITGQCGKGFDNQTQTAWVFEPHVAEKIFGDLVREAGVEVFRECRLDRTGKEAVKKSGSRIVSFRTEDGDEWRARQFIDASYEGDLMAGAGVAYTIGREGNKRYGETLNGVQCARAGSHQFSTHDVNPHVKPGDPASGLLPGINPEPGGFDGDGDSRVQAYCYRLCMSDDPTNQVRFAKPEGYDEKDYELFLRHVEHKKENEGIFLMINSRMPNRKTDTNNGGAVSHDLIGGADEYPEASYAERREIEKRHEHWQRGLMWTLQNHPRVPASVRAEYAKWGLAKDEFAENDHFPSQIYVREARRMLGSSVLTENHCRRLRVPQKPIAYGSYTMDSHHCQRYLATNGIGRAIVRNEGDIQVLPGWLYPIDYGIIVPTRQDAVNLFVPVCVSASHSAYGTVRMEPVFMVLAQVAATAAAIAIDDQCAAQQVEYLKLIDALKRSGNVTQADTSPPLHPGAERNPPPGEFTISAWRGEKIYRTFDIANTSRTEKAVVTLKIDGLDEACAPRTGFARLVNGDWGIRNWDPIDWGSSLTLNPGEGRRAVFEFTVPKSGACARSFAFVAGDVKVPVKLELSPFVQPSGKEVKSYIDLWQHPWAVARYFKVKPFSKEHYDKMRPLWEELAELGQKSLTVTILDLPWDHQCYDGYYSMIQRKEGADGQVTFDYAIFDAYVEFGRSCGIGPDISCYTMCPWNLKEKVSSTEYQQFWSVFLKDFSEHLRAKGWLGQVSIAMDERKPDDMRKIVKLVKACAPELKITTAGDMRGKSFDGIEIDNYSQSFAELNDDFKAFLPTVALKDNLVKDFVAWKKSGKNLEKKFPALYKEISSPYFEDKIADQLRGFGLANPKGVLEYDNVAKLSALADFILAQLGAK